MKKILLAVVGNFLLGTVALGQQPVMPDADGKFPPAGAVKAPKKKIEPASKAQLDRVETKLDKLIELAGEGFGKVDKRLAGLESGVAGLTKKVGGLDTRLSGVETELAELTKLVGKLNVRIAGLDKAQADANVQFASLLTSNEALRKEVRELKSRPPVHAVHHQTVVERPVYVPTYTVGYYWYPADRAHYWYAPSGYWYQWRYADWYAPYWGYQSAWTWARYYW